MNGSLVWGHLERWPWAVAVFALGLLLTWSAYRGWSGARRRHRLLLAAGFKLSIWAILAAVVCDPLWVSERANQDANEVIIAVDASLRLQVPEQMGSEARSERVKRAISEDAAWLKALDERFQVRLTEAGTRLRSVASIGEIQFDSTHLSGLRGVMTLRRGGLSRSVGAVVWVTDGHGGDRSQLEELVSEKGAAVFPVLVNGEREMVDLALGRLGVSQTPFEDTPVTVHVQVRALGWEGRDWRVVVVDEAGKLMGSARHRVKEEDELGIERVTLKGVKPGVSFFRVILADGNMQDEILANGSWRGKSEEATLKNNERWLEVDRGAGPYRVLYVSGRPNWEYKFLRRSLAADPEMQMPALIRVAKREPKFEWRGRAGETSNPLFRGFGSQDPEEVQRYDQPVLIRLETLDAEELRDGFPKSAEELFGSYRGVILDDLEADFFTPEQQRLVERFVAERGGALLTLGGQESYQGGGYEDTPIGSMLPVYLEKIGRADPIEDGRLLLTREGWLAPSMRLRAEQSEEESRMSKMPGFFAVNQVDSIKPGASMLASIRDQEARVFPAVVTQRFGEGRVVSVLLADVWRWGMRDEESRRDMEQMWRQLLRWMVVDVPDRVVLQVGRAVADAGVFQMRVQVRDKAFQPLDGAMVRMEVTSPNGEVLVVHGEPSLKEAGVFEAEFVSRETGGYRVEAVVERLADDEKSAAAPTPVGRKQSGWVHDPVADALTDLRPDTEWLSHLASATGGEVIEFHDVDELPEKLQQQKMPLMNRRVEPFWHAPWFFALVLGLLTGEWTLRRGAGRT